MGKSPRSHSADFKFKVALEALKEIKSINQIASEYENGLDAKNNLELYMQFYNKKRFHQSLKYKTPQEVYFNF